MKVNSTWFILPLTIALLSLSVTASAQRAALVQDADSDARSPYQEGVVTSCAFAGDCAMVFSAVPPGKRRVIEQVSCLIEVTGGFGWRRSR